jgi:hypothetical protein
MKWNASAALSREQLAWAAGFFDGEGCFCYSEAGRYICISIGQTDRELLDRFRGAVGGLGKILCPYEHRGPGRYSRKPQFVYRLNRFEHVQAVVALLWFMLGSQKRGIKLATCYEGSAHAGEAIPGSEATLLARSAPPDTGNPDASSEVGPRR